MKDSLEKRLKSAALAGIMAVSTILPLAGNVADVEAKRINFDKKSWSYDVYLASFSKKANAKKEAKRLRGKMPSEIASRVKTVRENNAYQVILDVNTTADHAGLIIDELKEGGISKDAYKKKKLLFYTNRKTFDREAWVVVENNFTDTIKEFTTAYGKEVGQTRKTLLKEYKRRSLDTPRKGDLAPIPIRWLKVPYQIDMKEGEDFYTKRLEKGKSLWKIVSEYTVGDQGNNLEIIRKFNAIRKSQQDKIDVDTPIMIPANIYHNPREPVQIERANGHYELFREELPKRMKQALEEKIPEARAPKKRDTGKNLKKQDYAVLKRTRMPAVIAESFNLQNWEQQQFYIKEKNMKKLAEAYGQGIIDYKTKHKQSLTTVIVENGHGEHGPGSIDITNGTKRTEGLYAKRIWKFLVDYLKKEGPKHGLKVHPLNFQGSPKQSKRLDYYLTQANKVGNANNSIYFSVHINSMNRKIAPPPQMFVGKGQQKYSTLLAEEVLDRAVTFYQKNFKG